MREYNFTDMEQFNMAFKNLAANESEVEALSFWIGQKVRYVIPIPLLEYREFVALHGVGVLNSTYEVVGVQRDFRGRPCLRIKCLQFNDDLGRCVSPDILTPINKH